MMSDDLIEVYQMASAFERLAIQSREVANAAWAACNSRNKVIDNLLEKIAGLEAENARLKEEKKALNEERLYGWENE